MEVILATAFGREVDIQRGESDDLTEATYAISQSLGEGQLTSREMMYLIFSQFYKESLRVAVDITSYSCICTPGNFPWALPLGKLVLLYSSKGDLWRYIHKIALV
jgi:hypothetical protein